MKVLLDIFVAEKYGVDDMGDEGGEAFLRNEQKDFPRQHFPFTQKGYQSGVMVFIIHEQPSVGAAFCDFFLNLSEFHGRNYKRC